MSFPPYSYVCGRFPHPHRHPDGHSFGERPPLAPPLDPQQWRESAAYLRGIELFNHGFYWEAHEAWEAVWIAAGRQGLTADFIKALIRLACAGVKAREGNVGGIARHARRSGELLEALRGRLAAPDGQYMGLCLPELLCAAGKLAENPQQFVNLSPEPVAIVMPWALTLCDA